MTNWMELIGFPLLFQRPIWLGKDKGDLLEVVRGWGSVLGEGGCVRDKEREGGPKPAQGVFWAPPPLWSELQFNSQPEICFGQMLQMFRQPGLWSSGVTQEGMGVQRLYAQRFNKAAWGWIYSHLYSLAGPPDACFWWRRRRDCTPPRPGQLLVLHTQCVHDQTCVDKKSVTFTSVTLVWHWCGEDRETILNQQFQEV